MTTIIGRNGKRYLYIADTEWAQLKEMAEIKEQERRDLKQYHFIQGFMTSLSVVSAIYLLIVTLS